MNAYEKRTTTHQVERLFKILFGFAGEANHNVGGERQLWYFLFELLHEGEVSLPSISAVHLSEHRI